MYGEGQIRVPHYDTNVCKITRHCGAISLLATDVLPLNSLTRKRSFQQGQWIFAYWYLSKLQHFYTTYKLPKGSQFIPMCTLQEL